MQSGRVNSAFQLTVNYPRRVLTSADGSRTLEELGLCPSAQLLVEDATAASQPSPRTPGATGAVGANAASVCERVLLWVYALIPGMRNAAPVRRNDTLPPASRDTPAAPHGQIGSSQNGRSGGEGGDFRRRNTGRVQGFRNSMDGERGLVTAYYRSVARYCMRATHRGVLSLPLPQTKERATESRRTTATRCSSSSSTIPILLGFGDKHINTRLFSLNL